MSNQYTKDDVIKLLEKITKDLEKRHLEKSKEKVLNNQYLSTIIYDPNSNDKTLIIRDTETKKQSELDIKNEYNGFYIKNVNGNKVNLENILDRDNYNKLELAHKENNFETFILNKNELNSLDKEKIIEKDDELNINIDNKLSNDPIFKLLNADKELMKQAMLFYQQSKVLDVLTKAREQLENVNYAINKGLDVDETRGLQSSLNDDVKHLESRSHKINNSLANNNVLQKINEQSNEKTEPIKKYSRDRSRSEELTL